MTVDKATLLNLESTLERSDATADDLDGMLFFGTTISPAREPSEYLA